MEKSHKWWVISAICVFIMGISGFGFLYNQWQSQSSKQEGTAQTATSSQDSKTTEPLNQQLPDFSMQDLDGNAVAIKDFYDKPMVIVDWASWCPDCREHLPEIQKVYEEYQDKVQFVMINLTDGKRETKEQGLTFPHYFDEGEVAGNAFKVRYIPSTYFVDKEQGIRVIFSRRLTADQLKEQIKAIL
ncbi:TlpA family protein disulfide reductase [Streptococcus ovuberis]|uniref:TlpA family protein disulfide reductase n=1 Tax=Streptococcus ovuberis TaxID=1936207 RepID=A0A7X6N0T3_9STRE|nr:TlpA disulfide reductase family protein [Streptococcus ovuberis]NKZ20878.1 TlpA family protein disulfide reductase [Streptococcus ovuberis]